MTQLALLFLFTIAVNVPFGFWREGVTKFSVAWFIAVHAAVPLILGVRLALGIEFEWLNLPFLVFAYFAGQAVGARLRRRAVD